MAALGGLDILVNNAGKQTAVERVEDLDDAQFEATFKDAGDLFADDRAH